METKNIINIPEGYEIDKEQSTERQIVLRKIDNRARSWEEYCKKMEDKDSYYFNEIVGKICSAKFKEDFILSEFVDDEDVVAFVAFSKLRKLRRDWLGKNWKPDWTNVYQPKYAIANSNNKLVGCTCREISHPLSFPTEEMRDEFFDCFKDYLEQAKSLL